MSHAEPRPPAGTPPDPDVCIVGAGPAGLALAHELLGSGLAVAVLESGARDPDPRQRSLGRGEVRGDPYEALVTSRAPGGSATAWNTSLGDAIGARYTPLDAIDFRGDPRRPEQAWPFDRDTLRPYYDRAQTACGLGPFRYDAADWAPSPAALLGGEAFASRIYQFGAARWFAETYPARLRDSSDVSLCTGATVRRVALREGRVRMVEGALRDGTPFALRPRLAVLAAGAIQNARLLLCSGDTPESTPGNRHGWVGRGFMEHPRDRRLRLAPTRDDIAARLAFYDRHAAPDGTVLAGRIAPTEAWLASEGLPNFSVSFVPDLPAPRLPWWLRSRLARLGWRARPTGFGWSASGTARGRPPLRALIHLEQRPHPDNRVRLGAARDRFGTPLPVLEWRWREDDEAALERIRAAVRAWLDGTGLFDIALAPAPLDPNAYHHAGTTRFHADPRLGVADADGLVRGTENLYVTGASLFPGCGVANPTLTIVALAIRLADHCRAVLGAGTSPEPRNSATVRRSRSR